MNKYTVVVFPFHETTTTVSVGEEISTLGISTMTIEITGTSTTSTCVFEGQVSDGGAFYAVDAIRLSDSFIANETTGINEIWQMPTIGYSKIRVNVTAIADGSISVIGRGVN